MADGIGQADISKRYPVVDGITSGTTTQEGHIMNLQPQGVHGVKSVVRHSQNKGLTSR